MTIEEYLINIAKRYGSGISSEHSYRTDLEHLIRELAPGFDITNEPSHVTDCGNPDYVITKGKIPIGYIEAKDIGKDLNSKNFEEQFTRYKKALDNLIITDYTRFQYFRHADLIHEIRIGRVDGTTIRPLSENFNEFENLIKDFCTYIGPTIKSSKRLAEMMAAKARLLENILERATTSDEKTHDNTSLKEQYQAFKQILIHDLTPKGFADIYAQTLAYGMFAARLNDTSLKDFNRQEAAELIPKTNPFLRRLFGYIAGPDIDDRIKSTVDNLADVFRAADVNAILHNFGKATQTEDPIMHFYETFLYLYDPKLRKKRGVYYTPEPVVNFIVRSVDEILKSEFGLLNGLADTEKTKIKIKNQSSENITTSDDRGIEQIIHKVQILDPAAGTGTFLVEIVKHIYNTNFKSIQGVWSGYVDEELIPRLNGFELLMASYSMAHLKLDMFLNETGYISQKNHRFNIYLTNSLEEYHPDTGTLFAGWLSSEANEANHIKRDTPVMVVLGNPPYSVSSSNKGNWIEELMKDYKYGLHERNINPLSDDYLKFIRYGQYLIERTNEGVLIYITNNSFLDGIIHRQMRKTLIEVFDKIYILNLHGSNIKPISSTLAGNDENVFDIQQGVSINIFVKSKNCETENLATVYSNDIFGDRQKKYKFLQEHSVHTINWNHIDLKEPYYYFIKSDHELYLKYSEFRPLDEIFDLYATGIKTERDNITIKFREEEIKTTYTDFTLLSEEEIKERYNITTEGRDWKVKNAIEDICINAPNSSLILYRPFDYRFTLYSGKTKGFMAYPRQKIMKHVFNRENYCLIATRKNRGLSEGYFFVSNEILDLHVLDSAADSLQTFPLFKYIDEETTLLEKRASTRIPNFNKGYIEEFSSLIGLIFSAVERNSTNYFTSLNLLDYIYGIFYSTVYRLKYKEFLKREYPRIPFPKNKDTFWKIVELGSQLRELHCFRTSISIENETTFPVYGSNKVDKISYRDLKVWINRNQYFDNIPNHAWDFYIGGYQPAQKWLKDRKGRQLSYEDILHYQKIIVALVETGRLMKKIDKIEIE